MTIKDFQIKVDNWINKFGVRYFDEKTNMLILMEEVGELSRLMSRQYGEQSFKSDEMSIDAMKRIGDEMSDIFFVLTCLANQMDIDLEEELNRNLAKKTNRDQLRHITNEKLKGE